MHPPPFPSFSSLLKVTFATTSTIFVEFFSKGSAEVCLSSVSVGFTLTGLSVGFTLDSPEACISSLFSSVSNSGGPTTSGVITLAGSLFSPVCNFDDESGSMDGIILSELYEDKYGIIKEGTILRFYGSVEVDDYRSRETNSTMYRMRIKNINAVESDLVDSKKDLLIICDTVNGDSLQEIKLKLNKIDSGFWGGESKVKLKILKDSTEALISLNDNFMIDLNSENLDNLRSIFGDNKIKLS